MEELRPGTVNPKINPILKGTFSVISNDLKRILIYRRGVFIFKNYQYLRIFGNRFEHRILSIFEVYMSAVLSSYCTPAFKLQTPFDDQSKVSRVPL